MMGLTAGSGGQNAGVITAHHTTTTANVFAKMPVGGNQTQICAYSVPAGKTAYLKFWDVRVNRASGASGSANVALMIRENGGLWRTTHTLDIATGNTSPMEIDYAVAYPALTDIVARVTSVSDNATSCTSHFFGVVVDD